MLIISRRAGERIMVGDEVMEIVGKSVRVGIRAPRSGRARLLTGVCPSARAGYGSE